MVISQKSFGGKGAGTMIWNVRNWWGEHWSISFLGGLGHSGRPSTLLWSSSLSTPHLSLYFRVLSLGAFPLSFIINNTRTYQQLLRSLSSRRDNNYIVGKKGNKQGWWVGHSHGYSLNDQLILFSSGKK